MSTSSDLTDDQLLGLDLAEIERVLEQTHESLAELRAGRSRPDDQEVDVEGEGSDESGQVRAIAKPGAILTTLELDPKALRAEPEDLGAHLTEAINQALKDLRTKAGQQYSNVDPEAVAHDVREFAAEAADRLAEVSDRMSGGLAAIEELASTERVGRQP